MYAGATLFALEDYLKNEYVVVFMDFQGISTAECRDEFVFTKAYMRMFMEAFKNSGTASNEISPDEEYKYNSSWNIATSFDIAMSFLGYWQSAKL